MEHKLKELSFSSSRIESLTDGIFAFAMTLLVLNLNAPELHGAVTNEELILKLMALSHRFFIFLVSFFVLASAWGIHHRQFSYITQSNNTLVWINMVRLLFVIVIPFSSVLIGSYPDLPAASFFFSMNVFSLCVVTFFEWRYAIAKKFTKSLPLEHLNAGDLKNFYSIIVSAIACVFSLYYATSALLVFLFIPVGFYILKKTGKIT